MDDFEQRVAIIVRAIIALALVGAYVALTAAGRDVSEPFVLLVGAGAGFFLGGVPLGKKP